ncbi:hypothetical protein D7I44_17865 (plasmid) [Gryllotalpicola protaetiae]|uniref:Replication protein n=2 Tax=Gryllotalpicola protaetiae TaxID=2419771 RepID=A0A387BTY3_9MICO|nr:hypothetical protein D7I44_17865 [Gryllotalpicola protaetiae]
MDHLASAEGEELRRRISIRSSTLLRFAAAEAEAASSSTGRDVATSHASLAAACDMSVATARRCRQWLILAGFCEVVAQGRYLTVDERAAAEAQHGGRQLRAASTRALTQPRKAARDVNEHLPRRGLLQEEALDSEVKTTRAYARATAAARPELRTRKSRRGRAGTSPRSLATIRLAAAIDTTPPSSSSAPVRGWLTQGRHVGVLWKVLDELLDSSRYAWVDEAGQMHVDAGDIMERINAWHVEHGGDPAARSSQRDRLAYFRWQLQQAIDSSAETRVERARRQKFEIQEARRQATAERKRLEKAASTPEAEAEKEAFLGPHREQRARSSRGSRRRFSDPAKFAAARAELELLKSAAKVDDSGESIAACGNEGDCLADRIAVEAAAHPGGAFPETMEGDRVCDANSIRTDVVMQEQLGVDVDVSRAVGVSDTGQQDRHRPLFITSKGGEAGTHVDVSRSVVGSRSGSWIAGYREAVRAQLVEQLLREHGEVVPRDELEVEGGEVARRRGLSHEQESSTIDGSDA